MNENNVREKVIEGHKFGGLMLVLTILMYVVSVPGLLISVAGTSSRFRAIAGILALFFLLYLIFGWILFLGLKVLKPGEALVLTLFGKYVGTLKGDGFFFVNPFCTAFNPAAATKLGQSGDIVEPKGHSSVSVTSSGVAVNSESLVSKKISLKVMTLNNSKQKVNDVLGNPVEIAVAVMWRVSDTAKAVFNVDNYK